MRVTLAELRSWVVRLLAESESGRLLYHGTTSDVVASVLRNGLQPDREGEVWLTSDRDTAFMNGAMRQFYRKRRYDVKPVILVVDLPSDVAVERRGSGDIVVKGSIPASNVRVSSLTPDEVESFESHLKTQRKKSPASWR